MALRRAVLRRRAFSLPHADELPQLVGALRRDPAAPVAPRDAEGFVDAALYHGVAGYAAAAIESEALSLPRVAQARLARDGALVLARSSALRRELGAVAPVLADACGTAPVCLKGPALAERFYPERRLRPFVDLDLLLPRDRLAIGAAALVARGYELRHEFRPGFGERRGHDVHLIRSAGALALHVELHWRVGDDPLGARLDHARLLGADELTVEEERVAVPAVPEQLLCVALHLLSDRAKRLIWVQDLTLVADAASEAAWRRGFELARELELDWALHRALDYASHHLGLNRERPIASGPPPRFGPLRAVEELDLRASTHVGRLAPLGWRERARYMREVLVPTREGLRGTVGHDGASTWRLVGRHTRSVLLGLRPRRR